MKIARIGTFILCFILFAKVNPLQRDRSAQRLHQFLQRPLDLQYVLNKIGSDNQDEDRMDRELRSPNRQLVTPARSSAELNSLLYRFSSLLHYAKAPLPSADRPGYGNWKRNVSCLKKCMAQGFLHPAQCHSLC